MKKGIRYSRLSAAIVGVLCGAAAHAQSVTWDPTQSDTNPPVDGSGNWDLSTTNWYNSGTAMDVQWSNAAPYSAVFGNPTSAVASAGGTENNVTLAPGVSINAQDIVLGTATNGTGNGYYSFFDQGDGNETITLNGNLIKASAVGESVFQLSSPIVLPAGNHVVAINDTPVRFPNCRWRSSTTIPSLAQARLRSTTRITHPGTRPTARLYWTRTTPIRVALISKTDASRLMNPTRWARER